MPDEKLFKRAGEKLENLLTIQDIRIFLELDPASTITLTDIANWNTAYGWGNHALAGYLTALPSHTHPLSELQQSGATTGQIPQWSGTAWVPIPIPSGYTDEQAQDAIGAMISTEFTYGDATPLLSINAIAFSKITGTVPIAQGGTALTALGTALQLIRVNAGATALEYFTPTYVTGNIYTTDGTITGNRALTLDTFTFSIKKASNTYFHIFNNGNIRIDTGTPADSGHKLQIIGDIKISGYTCVRSDVNEVAIKLFDLLDTQYYTIGRNFNSGYLVFNGTQNGYSGYYFKTSAGTVMTISNTGDLTITGAFTQNNLNLSNGDCYIQFNSGGVGAKIQRTGSNGSINLYLQNNTNASFNIFGYHTTTGVVIIDGATSAYQLLVRYNDSNHLGLNITSAGVAVYSLSGASMSFNKPIKIGTIGSISTKAILDLQSTTLGLLPPRMTATQAEAISSPTEGLFLYATDGSGSTITSKGWWGYEGSTWVKFN